MVGGGQSSTPFPLPLNTRNLPPFHRPFAPHYGCRSSFDPTSFLFSPFFSPASIPLSFGTAEAPLLSLLEFILGRPFANFSHSIFPPPSLPNPCAFCLSCFSFVSVQVASSENCFDIVCMLIKMRAPVAGFLLPPA